jgi:hypothetical protein
VKVGFLFLIAFVLGCASAQSKGPIFSAQSSIPQGKSLIYFYIADELLWSNACLIVTIDSKERGCIGTPGYLEVSLDPGEHSFSFRPKAMIDVGVEMRKFVYKTESDRVYYLESKEIKTKHDEENALQINYVDTLVGHSIGWVLTDEKEALSKLASLRQWE